MNFRKSSLWDNIPIINYRFFETYFIQDVKKIVKVKFILIVYKIIMNFT